MKKFVSESLVHAADGPLTLQFEAAHLGPEDFRFGPVLMQEEGFLFKSNRNALPISYVSIPRKSVPKFLGRTEDALLAASGADLRTLDGSFIPGPTPGYWNYAHLLIDVVPRLIHSLARAREGTRIVISRRQHQRLRAASGAGLREIAAFFGFADAIEVVENRLVALNSAHYPTACGRSVTLAHAAMAAAIRERWPRRRRRRRLYVTRRAATARRVVNEAVLRPLLSLYGFETVTLEETPFAEQVRLFAEADIVMGPHGAGLANALFCRPGTAIVELLHPRGFYKAGLFSELAAATGARHVVVETDAVENRQHPARPGTWTCSSPTASCGRSTPSCTRRTG